MTEIDMAVRAHLAGAWLAYAQKLAARADSFEERWKDFSEGQPPTPGLLTTIAALRGAAVCAAELAKELEQ